MQDPNENTIMDKEYRDSPGKFTFTSTTPGEHIICLHTEGRWFGAQMLVCLYERIHCSEAQGWCRQSRSTEQKLKSRGLVGKWRGLQTVVVQMCLKTGL